MKERSAIYIGIGSALLALGLFVTTPSLQGANAEQAAVLDSTANRSKARAYYFQAVLAQQSSKTTEAFDLLSHAHALDPQDADIAYLLGEIYANLGRGSEALSLLEQAYRQDSTSRTFARTLAQAYMQAERMQDALRIHEHLLSMDPEDDDLRYRLVQLYARTGELKSAIHQAEALQRKFTEIPEAYEQITRLKIQLLTMTKDKSAVEQEYRRWAERYPEDRKPYYDWILYLLQEGQGEQVEKRLKKDLASRRITAGDASALRIHKFILAKDYAAAEAELLRLNSLPQVAPREKLTLWMLLLKEAQGSEGYSSQRYLPGIRQLVEQHPEDLDILLSYAQLLRYGEEYQTAFDLIYPQTKRHPEAERLWAEVFENAIGISSDSLLQQVAKEALPHVPTDWRSYVILAGKYLQADDYQAATKILEQGTGQIDPKTGFGAGRIYGLLADLYAERGGESHREQTDSLYRLAIEANPQDGDVMNNYAYRLAKRGGDLAEAERYAGLAVKLLPDAAHVLDTYAYILLLQKNFTLAKLYQRKALDQAGEKASADMYDHLGDILLGTGDLEAAVEAWQQAQHLNGDKKIDPASLVRKLAQAQKQLKKK